MVDRTIKRPIGVLHNVLVKVDSFIIPVNFFILYVEVDLEVSIILGRPFLASRRGVIYMDKGWIKFSVNNKEGTFDSCR